ncbi:MAG: hypothetical protein H7250_08930 [Flavobacterium sp.]|nr:hypothetical protein [Flavobacterium sp.]
MDNNTTYIDDFQTDRTKIKEWNEYFPKAKEGKKPLPKKYNYFRRRLYSERGNSFLLLSLRYDDEEDIFRLRITGSVKKWFLNGNTLEDLTRQKFESCYKKISEKIGVLHDDILEGRNTKIESGITICLKTKFKDLLKSFVWYNSFDRVEENDTTLYFRGAFYSFILYEKQIEIKNKNSYRNGRFIRANKPTVFSKTYLRFEVKVNSVSGVKFYEEKANTIKKIIANWDEIIMQIQTFFEDIEFIDINANEKEFKKSTFSKLKKYTMFREIKNFGLPNYLKLFKKEVQSGSNVTKYRNEIFSLFRSHVIEDINLREELLFEFERKINSLIYNKLNITSNSNNLLIDE